MSAVEDCCVGEPCLGYPSGMHSLDCPVYLASMEALERQRPIRTLPPLMPGGESTKDQLRRVRQELSQARAEIDRLGLSLIKSGQANNALLAAASQAAQDRDQISAAVAGWVERFHAAYEALYIEEFDGDSCPDLETTIAYAVSAYRRVCESEAAAADQIIRLRAELASARGELKTLRGHQEIRARVIREKNAKLREVEHLLGIDALVPHADVADAVRELLAEVARYRTIPTSKEKTMPATDDGPIATDDEIEIQATTVGVCTFRVNRAEYEQALADGEVDDLFDVYVSDMDEETTYTTPDGRVHAYPSGEVIGDESDGAF